MSDYLAFIYGACLRIICALNLLYFWATTFWNISFKCENEMFKFNRQIFHLRFFVYKIIVFEVNMKANSDSKFSIKNNESNFKGNVL